MNKTTKRVVFAAMVLSIPGIIGISHYSKAKINRNIETVVTEESTVATTEPIETNWYDAAQAQIAQQAPPAPGVYIVNPAESGEILTVNIRDIHDPETKVAVIATGSYIVTEGTVGIADQLIRCYYYNGSEIKEGCVYFGEENQKFFTRVK